MEKLRPESSVIETINGNIRKRRSIENVIRLFIAGVLVVGGGLKVNTVTKGGVGEAISKVAARVVGAVVELDNRDFRANSADADEALRWKLNPRPTQFP